MSALLSVEAAQTRLLALCSPLSAVSLSLAASRGHFMAEPLFANRTQPAAALSAMDGYAIRFADLPGPWRLTGSIAAGSMAQSAFIPGDAMRIFTGAMLPTGADTILIQEDADNRAGTIHMTGDGPAKAGQHVRKRGGDFNHGDLLAQQGVRVTAGIIALAAMAGFAELRVGTAPRVAIISTGDELIAPGAPAQPGKIADSNSAMLAAMLAAEPAHLATLQRIGDDRDATISAIDDASRAHDVIVIVGGASVGDHDHVHAALTSLGSPPDFWRVAMRPGKPVMAARVGDAIVLGLPGNPASAFVTAQLFLLPLIRHLAGAAAPLPAVAQGKLSVAISAGSSRREYLRAVFTDGMLTPCHSQDSGFVMALAHANALVIRDIDAPAANPGDFALYIAI